MQDLSFLSIFLALPIVLLFLLRVAGERVNRVSIVSISVIALYLFSVVGTLPLYFMWDDYRVAIGITDSSLVLTVLEYSSLNIIGFLLGVIVVRQLLGWRPVPFVSREIQPLGSLQFLGVIALLGLSGLVFAAYIASLKDVAIFVALKDGAEAAKAARSAMGNSFAGKYHWYKLAMADLGDFSAYCLFAVWLRRKTLATLLAFLVSFFYALFVAVMATEKAPAAWLLIGLFMTFYLTKRDGRVPVRRALYLGCGLLVVLIASYIYFMGSRDVGSALGSIFSRAFSGSIAPAYFYLEYFPFHHDFLYGKTFQNIASLFPYVPVRYTVEIMNWKFPQLAAQGIVGSMPTVFWGESYVNFGPWLIAPIAFVVGAVVAVVSFLLSKIELNPLTIALTVWLILEVKNLAYTGFSEFFPDFYAAFVCLASVVLLGLRGNILIRRRAAGSTEGRSVRTRRRAVPDDDLCADKS